MFIKQITLCGFKSYKEKTTVKELCNGFNVIVGRNGSGKSNIFSALEFALSSEFKTRARASLLSIGRTPSDSAYIEILFDNSDRKLMVDFETVEFRRVLGVKKDRFFVNGKEMSTMNVKQFLENAGFSNPYFIVKQGKVQDLAMANDTQRLKAITDVAGYSGFDVKIKDCQKSIEDAEKRRKEIEEILQELKSRKETLMVEVEHQKRNIKFDQIKRAIELVLHERELKLLQKKIDEAEARRNDSHTRQRPICNELEKVSRDLQILKRDVDDLELRKKTIEDLTEQYKGSKDEIARAITEKRQELHDLKHESPKTFDSTNVETLAKDVNDCENLLQEIETSMTDVKTSLLEKDGMKRQLEAKINMLTEREVQRDNSKKNVYQNYLKTEISSLRTLLQKSDGTLKSLEDSLKRANAQLQKEMTNFEALKKTLANTVDEIKLTNQSLGEYQSSELQLKAQLEAHRREISESEQKCAEKRERLAGLEENFIKVHGRQVADGIKGVKQIIEDFRSSGTHSEVIEGYYGLVAEHLQYAPLLDLAVEAAGGKKLAYHIVQSNTVAQVILKEFNSRKYRGVINFIPLAGLYNRDSQGETPFSPTGLKGLEPMMSQIRVTNANLLPVAEFIFGKTFLCESLERATDFMKKFKMRCVTLDGDIVSKRGEIMGGYIRRNLQKSELQRAKVGEEKELAEWSARKETLIFESDRLKLELRDLKQKIQECSTQGSKLKDTKCTALSCLKNAEKQITSLKHDIEMTEKNIQDFRIIIASSKEKIDILKNGDQTADKSEISKTIRKLCSECNVLRKEYSEYQKKRSAVDAKLQHLRKRYYNFLECSSNEGTVELQVDRISELIDSLKSQMDTIKSKISTSKKEAQELQKIISEKQKMVSEMADKESKLKSEFAETCRNLEFNADNVFKLTTNLKKHTTTVAARLGSVPENLGKFEAMSDRELYEKLKKVNLKLKNLGKSGINQKALHEFKELEEKVVKFEERLTRSDQEKEDLMQLLEDLETRRGEALLQNIRTLQEQFQSIFCLVVPRGNAELVVYGQDVSLDRHNNMDSDDLRGIARQNLFEGATIHVNFRGKNFHTSLNLASLSGGQKSIVALCLILALQTINPVPFYLFDEVDQALDGAYRDAVARTIGKLSEQSQFICTTFRPEFISVADKLYGVSYRNMCSTIQPVTEAQALDFVESETTDTESDVGNATVSCPRHSSPLA